MKLKGLILFLSIIALAPQLSAQRGRNVLLDVATGTSNAVEPFTVGYRSPTFGFFHAAVGARLMMNSKFGYRIIGGYDQIKNAPDRSLPFNSNYFRVSMEGVIDMGEVLSFKEFTHFFGLLLHGGIGYSGLSGNHHYTSMGHALSGLSLQLKVNQDTQFFLDITRVNSVYQQWKFDMMNPHNELGFDGMLFNCTVGVSIQL